MKCIVGKLYQRDPHPSCLQGKIFISITVRVNLIIKETFSPWHLGIPDAARWWRKFALYLDLNHFCLFLHVCPTYPVFWVFFNVCLLSSIWDQKLNFEAQGKAPKGGMFSLPNYDILPILPGHMPRVKQLPYRRCTYVGVLSNRVPPGYRYAQPRIVVWCQLKIIFTEERNNKSTCCSTWALHILF